jgi:hypothetical protein
VFSDADAMAIVDALTTFVKIHQQLLNTVSSFDTRLPLLLLIQRVTAHWQARHHHSGSLLWAAHRCGSEDPRGYRRRAYGTVSAPLRSTLILTSPSQSFAFALIAEIPTQKGAAQVQFSSLDATITVAINTYTQPSLPVVGAV